MNTAVTAGFWFVNIIFFFYKLITGKIFNCSSHTVYIILKRADYTNTGKITQSLYSFIKRNVSVLAV